VLLAEGGDWPHMAFRMALITHSSVPQLIPRHQLLPACQNSIGHCSVFPSGHYACKPRLLPLVYTKPFCASPLPSHVVGRISGSKRPRFFYQSDGQIHGSVVTGLRECFQSFPVLFVHRRLVWTIMLLGMARVILRVGETNSVLVDKQDNTVGLLRRPLYEMV
jgi:hypothetical protein